HEYRNRPVVVPRPVARGGRALPAGSAALPGVGVALPTSAAGGPGPAHGRRAASVLWQDLLPEIATTAREDAKTCVTYPWQHNKAANYTQRLYQGNTTQKGVRCVTRWQSKRFGRHCAAISPAIVPGYWSAVLPAPYWSAAGCRYPRAAAPIRFPGGQWCPAGCDSAGADCRSGLRVG